MGASGGSLMKMMDSMMVFTFAVVTTCVSAMPFVIDDGESEQIVPEAAYNQPEEVIYLNNPEQFRDRRDSPYAPAPAYGAPKGKVGPVYTFVKTDPQANFKWGVRHRAG